MRLPLVSTKASETWLTRLCRLMCGESLTQYLFSVCLILRLCRSCSVVRFYRTVSIILNLCGYAALCGVATKDLGANLSVRQASPHCKAAKPQTLNTYLTHRNDSSRILRLCLMRRRSRKRFWGQAFRKVTDFPHIRRQSCYKFKFLEMCRN